MASYPTNDNSKWEPPMVQPMVLAPRRRSMIREEVEDGTFEEKAAPLGKWAQRSLCPCSNPTICMYSFCCCCCAMGDVGCYLRETWWCYPAYCIGSVCPCCIGDTREVLAEKYNLPIVSWDPEDCGACLVRLIGMRLMCFATVCFLPCAHVAQMRAEVAYRRHGDTTVCPCCCCWCGGGSAPGIDILDDADLDYPRETAAERPTEKKKTKEEPLDYPRAGTENYEAVLKPPEPKAVVVADYPRMG